VSPDREWRFIAEEAREGAVQMALDEVAAETVSEGGRPVVRVYRWDPSTLTLGYNQSAETVAWDYCARHGIDVTRRQTGGGGIYHDATGDISYSIVAPADAVPGDLLASYELLCEPILAALEHLGVNAAFATREHEAVHRPACYLRAVNPAHDILAGGRKISGNAQYRQRDAVVQHGSVTFARRPAHHLGVFRADLTAETFRDRVTSIREAVDSVGESTDPSGEGGDAPGEGTDPSRATAVQAIEDALFEWACPAERTGWTDRELDRATELAAQKYDAESWIREGVDPTTE